MSDAAENLAHIRITTGISVVIPTYREVENIPLILDKLVHLKTDYDLDIEVLFMDDDSRDGSVEAVVQAGLDWARMIVRTKDRGLSPAVIEGFRMAKHPVLVCMDCDLSHPVGKIPDMVLALSAGQQMVMGSRYVPGGSTDDNWGFFRWLNSRIATCMAYPLTDIKDPMSGFFALRKSDFEKAQHLNPIGYKVGLEIITKCNFENVAEIPIAFMDRRYGESKLTLKEQLRFIQHLRRLYLFKFSEAMHLAQFLIVGAIGLIVNLFFLSIASALGAPPQHALGLGITTSLISNFLLNRRFSFSYARDRGILSQFLGFVTASAVGMVVNFSVALLLQARLAEAGFALSLQIAAAVGVLAGMTFNFLGNRYFVFRKRYVR